MSSWRLSNVASIVAFHRGKPFVATEKLAVGSVVSHIDRAFLDVKEIDERGVRSLEGAERKRRFRNRS